LTFQLSANQFSAFSITTETQAVSDLGHQLKKVVHFSFTILYNLQMRWGVV